MEKWGKFSKRKSTGSKWARVVCFLPTRFTVLLLALLRYGVLLTQWSHKALPQPCSKGPLRIAIDEACRLNALLGPTKPGLSIHKNRLLVGGQVPKYSFSPTEEETLKRLVATPNEPVSYYDLGDLIWKDDLDRFSLWALSRLIFKIRNKLRKNGLSPEHVKNLRGRGYYYTSQP